MVKVMDFHLSASAWGLRTIRFYFAYKNAKIYDSNFYAWTHFGTLSTLNFAHGCLQPFQKEEKTEPIKLNLRHLLPMQTPAFFFVEKIVKTDCACPIATHKKNWWTISVATLKRYGAKVTEQNFEHELRWQAFFAKHHRRFLSWKQKPILLAAHWDTRPFADKNKDKPDAPFDGANDGAE